jgi:hypothetical protein
MEFVLEIKEPGGSFESRPVTMIVLMVRRSKCRPQRSCHILGEVERWAAKCLFYQVSNIARRVGIHDSAERTAS